MHSVVTTLYYSPLAIPNFTTSSTQDPQIQTVYIARRYGFGKQVVNYSAIFAVSYQYAHLLVSFSIVGKVSRVGA